MPDRGPFRLSPRSDAQGSPVTLDTLRKISTLFVRNNFDVCDEQLLPWAYGTYPIGALLNHSCVPNVGIVFEGRLQVRPAPAAPRVP